MPAATLTARGQVVIPAEIRARYPFTPGTQVEFVDEGRAIRRVDCIGIKCSHRKQMAGARPWRS